MNPHTVFDQDWQALLALLPEGRHEAAQQMGALLRKREIKHADTLLRLALVYAWSGYSLRTTVAWAAQKQIACLSDVALLHRLQHAEGWLGWLLFQKLAQQTNRPPLACLPYRVRLVDATALSQPGSQGTDWRVHLGLDLAAQAIDFLELTDQKGGESLTRFPVQEGDLLVGDRGYAHRAGLAHVVAAGGQVLVRFAWQNLPLQQPNGTPFDLVAALQTLSQDQRGDWPVQTAPDPKNGLPALCGRVIARKKTAQAAEAARRQALANAKKKGRTPDARTLLCCDYLFVFTTLPAEALDAETVLELYRFRWQIECGFKRLKSLLDLDALRAQEPRLCRSFLLSKLLGALLVQEWTCSWASFSPWGAGYSAPALAVASDPDALSDAVPRRGRGTVFIRLGCQSQPDPSIVCRPAA